MAKDNAPAQPHPPQRPEGARPTMPIPAAEQSTRLPGVDEPTPLPTAPELALGQNKKPLAGGPPQSGGTTTSESATRAFWPRVEGFEILEEIGRGGMGVVYKARQLTLNRLVALKLVRGGTLADADDRMRFRREAAAVAQLQHPNIVRIYAVGEAERFPGEEASTPYLALEYLPGGSLADRCGVPNPPEWAMAMVETVARAIHQAHQRKLIHRDLKPANVLLTHDGVPRISDFGLAKQLAPDLGSQTSQTMTGLILGTPEYMAPEQTRSQVLLEPTVDVYALGVMLYELLTGRLPFRGLTPLETLDLVRHQEPLPPTRLQPGLPASIDTICLKCLEKDPALRYSSALDLAEDLRRWRADQPILARPPGLTTRLWKWAHRRPAVAGLLGLVVVTLLAGLAGFYWQWQRAEERAESEKQARLESDLQRQEAERAREAETLARRAEQQARAVAERALYFSRIILAQRDLKSGNVRAAQSFLEQCQPQEGELDHRGWEWHYLRQQTHLELWSRHAPQEWVWALAWSPTGRVLASASGSPLASRRTTPGRLVLWDTVTGMRLAQWSSHNGPLRSVQFSPSGRYLLSTALDGTARIWDVLQQAPCSPLLPCQVPDMDAASGGEGGLPAFFTADEQGVILHGPQGWRRVRLDGTATGPVPEQGRVFGWSGDGRVRARFGATDQDLEVVEAASDKIVQRLNVGFPAQRAALSPDGEHLAITSPSRVAVLQVATGRQVQLFRTPATALNALTFSPDGLWLAAAGSDGVLRIWDVHQGRLVRLYPGHGLDVRALAFHPDGRQLASADRAGILKVWDLTSAPGGGVEDLRIPSAHFGALTFAPGGQRLLLVQNPTATLWTWSLVLGSQENSRHLNIRPSLHYPRNDTAFSGDGRRLAGPAPETTERVRVWDSVSGLEVGTFQHEKGQIYLLTLDGAGHRVASWSVPQWTHPPREASGEVRIWNVTTRELLTTFPATGLARLTLSDDGQLLALSDWFGNVSVHDAASGRSLWRQAAHGFTNGEGKPAEAAVLALAFDPKSEVLASGSFADGSVKLWKARTGQLIPYPRPLRSQHQLAWLTFSPDGQRLAGAGYDSIVQLWDVRSGQEALALPSPAGPRLADVAFSPRVVFSPDGQHLASVDWLGQLCLWSTTSQPASATAATCWHLRQAVHHGPDSGFGLKFHLRRVDRQLLVSSEARLARAQAQAYLGDWTQAALQVREVAAPSRPASPNPPWSVVAQCAALLLLAGETEQYQRYYLTQKQRCGPEPSAWETRWLAEIGGLGPLPAGEARQVLALAHQRLVDRPDDSWGRVWLALGYQRAGQPEAAQAALAELARQTPTPEPACLATSHLVRALLELGQKQKESARQALSAFEIWWGNHQAQADLYRYRFHTWLELKWLQRQVREGLGD